MMVDTESALQTITGAFLHSQDFNGVTARTLLATLRIDWPTLKDVLATLVREEKVGILFVDTDANPHVIRFGFEPVETQLERLETTTDLSHTCIGVPGASAKFFTVSAASYYANPTT